MIIIIIAKMLYYYYINENNRTLTEMKLVILGHPNHKEFLRRPLRNEIC